MARIMEQWEDPIAQNQENKELTRLMIVSILNATATAFTVNTGYAFTGELAFQFLVGYLPFIYALVSIVFSVYVVLRRKLKKSKGFSPVNRVLFKGLMMAGIAVLVVFVFVLVWCQIFY